MAEAALDKTVTVTRTLYADSEKEVVDKAQELAMKAIEQALDLLEYGSPQQKNTIIRAVLPSAIRRYGGTTQVSEKESVRMQLDGLFSEIRSVTPLEPVVTPTEIINVEVEAAPVPVEDQDEGFVTPTFGP